MLSCADFSEGRNRVSFSLHYYVLFVIELCACSFEPIEAIWGNRTDVAMISIESTSFIRYVENRHNFRLSERIFYASINFHITR